MTEGRRSYRSRRRRQQARETRRRILANARRLFVEHGYGGTTIRAIARGAGVSEQTIYATFGSKGALLLGLLDQMAADADLPAMQAQVAAASGDPRQQLRARVAFNVRFYSAGADLIHIARTVSGVEPDLAEMWKGGEARRYRATRSLVAEWERAGALGPGVTAEQAVDVLWALSGPDTFRLFVDDRQWDRDRYQRWLAGTLEALIFGGRDRPAPRRADHT